MNETLHSAAKGTILIVDDTPENLSLLSDALLDQGYGVCEATTGAMTFQVVQTTLPDLILLDIKLPDIDGYEVCRRLKASERTQRIPVVFLSALTETLDKVQAFAVGGVDFITKPLQLSEVFARIENQLAIYHLQQQLTQQNAQLQAEILKRQQAEAELHQLNTALEQTVLDRTDQLAVANRELNYRVAEYKRMAVALRESESRFRSLSESSPIGIFTTDTNGRYTYINPKGQEICGWTAAKSLVETWTQCLQTLDQTWEMEDWLMAIQSGQTCSQQFQFRHQDGGIRWVQIHVVPLRSETGDIKGHIGTIEDITDRKQVEDDLRASHQKVTSILESITEAFFTLDQDWRITYLNPKAGQLLQCSHDELWGKVFWDKFPKSPDSLFYQEFHRAVATKVSIALEEICPTLGSWFEVHAYPMDDGLAVYFQDITERKRAEQQIQNQIQREQALNRVIQAVRQSLELDHIFTATANEAGKLFQVEQVNIVQYLPEQQVWRVLANYRQNENDSSLVGFNIADEANPIAAQLKRLEIVRINDTGLIDDEANAALLPLMPTAWLMVPLHMGGVPWGSLTLMRDKQFSPWQDAEVHLACIVADQLTIAIQQSELYRQVQQLNATLEYQVQERTAQLQQARKFDALLNRITDKVRDSLDEHQILQTAVQELALGLNLIVCDTAVYDLAQRTSTVRYEYGASTRPQMQGTVWNMADFPTCYQQLLNHQWLHCCDCHTIQGWRAVLACPIFDDQGILGDLWLSKLKEEAFSEQEIQVVQQVANHCAIAIRQARLYAAAQAQVKELAKLNQLKDDFLSTVSHELRSPVTTMKMAIQMLSLALNQSTALYASGAETNPQKDESASRVGQYLSVLGRECDREINLINDLLDLQRLEANEYSTEAEWIELDQWLLPLTTLFHERAQARHQRLLIQIPDGLPLVWSNREALSRILTELLHNACKYAPPQEQIVLQVWADNLHITFRVTNFGSEIPVNELPNIFEKFYRVVGSDRWQQGGTGLGLALVKKLVDHLGGTITVNSAELTTSFTVVIPQTAAAVDP
ncbi:PAS domain S-box protein [Oculatella sp. LEGE 06141]|uniref:PAS domain S-box protein n=1 Tax=Oculatella sp. LEGE 06141 TaxID=1828648 RepID=UPI00187E38B4|nr:PAS domain S-box protein [Oculatella sp. LEGE 06141]MBE9182641.1 PAS domain S-box protein [Oculatella sp. LEGE 06141]